MARARVRDAGRDEVGAAEDQAGRLRSAQRLAAREHGQVGAFERGESPQVRDRRDLRRGVDDDRHAGCVGDVDDVGQRQRARREVGAGEVEDRGRA